MTMKYNMKIIQSREKIENLNRKILFLIIHIFHLLDLKRD